jgi:hypothetical protein
MTDNLATPDNQIVLMPQPQAPVASNYRTTGHLKRRTILDLTPHEFERLQFMAKVYAASTFNSKTAQSEGDFFLIMMKGLELGISPMAAVDTINIISGKPVLDAKGMLALVKSSGLLEDIQIDSTSERCIVTIKRVGNTEQMVSFTMEDAKRFKTYEKGGWIPLADKSNWKSQPTVMLKWRAVTSAMREVFPDVISGLYTPEELDSDTMVNDDGSMEIISTPVIETSTNKTISATNPPVSPRAKKLEETVAWHQESDKLRSALGHCQAKGWIEGATMAEQLASFASLVGQEIVSFETGKASIDAAEAAATKAANATPATAWDTLDGIQAIVTWAKGKGYGDNEPALLKLLGVSDWKAFADGRAACTAIAEAHAKQADKPAETAKETGKLSDIDMLAISEWTKINFNILSSALAERVDLSKCSSISTAKTLIKGLAREGNWPVMAEKVTYVVKKDSKGVEKKSLRFETILGEMSFFKGRAEFAKVAGETYATDNGILNLPANEEQDIEPLLITWRAKENYIEVADAWPIMEPELA